MVVSREQVQFVILQFQLPWLCRCEELASSPSRSPSSSSSLLSLSFSLSLPFAIHPSRKSWSPLTRRNTPTCANSFAESVPTLMHVRRTSGSAFTRIAVTGCGGRNVLVTKGEQSQDSTRCVGRVICNIQQK